MTNELAFTLDNSNNEKTFSDLGVLSESSIDHSASDTLEGNPVMLQRLY
jgi:hypothetical protein